MTLTLLSWPSRLLAIVAASAVVLSVGVVSATTAQAAGASHRAYVVTISDPKVSGDVSQSTAKTVVGYAMDYWKSEGRGAISSFSITKTSTLTLSNSCATGVTKLWALAAEKFPGVDFTTKTNHLIVFSPSGCSYGYGGMATYGSFQQGGKVHIVSTYGAVVAHELGHNFGLVHSNLEMAIGSTTTSREYMGLYSVMGRVMGTQYNAPALSAAERSILKLPGEVASEYTVGTARTTTRTYTINATHLRSGARSVKITDAKTGKVYFLEYRSGSGIDNSAFYKKWSFGAMTVASRDVYYRPGLTVSRAEGNHEVLLTSERPNGAFVSSVTKGQTFTRSGLPFNVKVISVSGTKMTIRVTIKGNDTEATAFSKEIAWMKQSGIARGYPDGTFHPASSVNRAAMAVFLYRMAGSPDVELPKTSPFKDVSAQSKFYKEIVWMYQEGISRGYSNGTFRPTTVVSRDQVAAFLYRLAGEPAFTAPAKSPFKDMTTSSALYKEVAWMAAQGITTGYSNGTFRPSTKINREQVSAFLYRLDGILERESNATNSPE